MLRTAALTVLSAGIAPQLFAEEAPVQIDDEVIKGTDLAKVTDKVYFDMKIGGNPAGRLEIGLFGGDAPISVESFKEACSSGIKGRAGRTAGYKGSVAGRVSSTYVGMGVVKQIDELNQSPGTPQRQTRAIVPVENREGNTLAHDARGIVSVKRGGGTFEFLVTLDSDRSLDNDYLVIGKILRDEQDVLAKIASVPTNRKTVRDGFRNVGRAIGDARAKVDLEEKPLQKIQIADCALL